ncbi:MAG: hypothetical protein K2J59_05065 [Eubacterium sp.]|nr:hypothetical protein [Eubacterium sp.]
MKKNKIQCVYICRIKIPKKREKEIIERLTIYHAKAIKQKSYNENLLSKQIAEKP